jgi:hypothetical protein
MVPIIAGPFAAAARVLCFRIIPRLENAVPKASSPPIRRAMIVLTMMLALATRD